MSHLLRSVIFALTLVLAGLSVSGPVPVFGQAAAPEPVSPVVSRVMQADQNDDGFIELTTLETNFAGGADRVLVFDGGEDMAQSDDWRVATDFENDTWVFDAGGDGRAELIIRFARLDESTVEARLFDDVDGDGMVAYHVGVGTGAAVITESRFPVLTVTSWPSWTTASGGLNYNLRIAQDGTYAGQEGTPEFLERMRRDGRPDYESVFADDSGDGIPDHRISRLLMPTPETSGLHRMGFQVNLGGVRPRENAAAVFWPLLGRSPNDKTGNYFDTAPSIDFDWTTARVRDAGIVGYPIEHGFHINSLNYLQQGVRNVPNFENEMAYYDLDGDRDGKPELFVRHRYYESPDPYGERVVPASNEIRYSWTDRNPNGLFWDYKLGLAGRHLISDTVRIGGYDLAVVPHERLPTWVTERTWDLATFVAREGSSYASSEGIYEWAPIEDKTAGVIWFDDPTPDDHPNFTASPYVRGNTATPPREKFAGMRPGLRGEYAFEYGIRPLLYVSPVDRRAHMLRAEAGIWQVNPTSAVRYADSNDDGWLDAWTYLEVDGSGRIAERRELHVLNDLIVYGDRQQVVIRRATVSPSTYDAVAPTNLAEVQALRAAVESLGPQPGPGDLRKMQQQFAGPEQRIANARLRDVRPLVGGGLRFVLEALPDFSLEGEQYVPMDGTPPGTYVVTVDQGGDFGIQPLTEPSFTLDAWGETEAGRHLAPNASGLIRVALSNVGLRDATNMTLKLARVSAQGDVTPLGEMSVDVLSGEPLQLSFPWLPVPPGQWSLHVSLTGPDGDPVLEQSREVDLQPAASPDARILDSSLPSTATLWPALVPLGLLALAMGFVTVLTIRATDARRRRT